MCIFLRPTMEAKLFLFSVTQPSTKQLFECVDVRTLSHKHKVLNSTLVRGVHGRRGGDGRGAVRRRGPRCSRRRRQRRGRRHRLAVLHGRLPSPQADIALLHCVRYSRCTCRVHSSGIGGGFVMTVFSAERQSAEVLVARERAPAWASEDMYGGDPALSAKVAVHVVSTLYLHSIYSVSTQYTHNIYTEYTQLST